MIALATILVVLLFMQFAGLGFDVVVKSTATIVCIILIPFMIRLYPLPLNSTFYSAQIKQLWLPPEAITLKSGQSFTGYVLADDGSWLVVLRNDNRAVIYYPPADVTSRQVCQIGPTQPSQPLIAFFPAGLRGPTHTRNCGSPSPSKSAARKEIAPPLCQQASQLFYLRCLTALESSRQ